MRTIIRKLNRKEELNSDEYHRLMHYIDKLREESPESYYVFYEKYVSLLYLSYNTLIPKYVWGMDNLINFLVQNPHLYDINNRNVALEFFPEEAKPYLLNTFGNQGVTIPPIWFDFLTSKTITEIPFPRDSAIVIKYEEANPFKEKGLKAHFDRLANYTFISRLQTYRYLTKNKASFDRFEVIKPDCLGGIFTNKEKSIYYYLFLTEDDLEKAHNANKLLNYTFYGKSDGD
ncbi:MAG TPA: hypothetical protein VFC73_04330 [Syntrophomonadaceae bacterium]|nr:hypothetical protein [Syntrophomonadaceae bacterium]